jgi:hypothetical protein
MFSGKTVLEVVKSVDGTFELYVDRKLDRSNISERYLVDELCVRFGYCGQEFETIMKKIAENGRASMSFGRIA